LVSPEGFGSTRIAEVSIVSEEEGLVGSLDLVVELLGEGLRAPVVFYGMDEGDRDAIDVPDGNEGRDALTQGVLGQTLRLLEALLKQNLRIVQERIN